MRRSTGRRASAAERVAVEMRPAETAVGPLVCGVVPALGPYRVEPARGFDREKLGPLVALPEGRWAVCVLGAGLHNIYPAAGATDRHKGFDGLCALVNERLKTDLLRDYTRSPTGRTRACGSCFGTAPTYAGERVVIGYDTGEQLDVEGARYSIRAGCRKNAPMCFPATVQSTNCEPVFVAGQSIAACC